MNELGPSPASPRSRKATIGTAGDESAVLPSSALAARVLSLRNKRGWSQAELARRMSVHGYSWDRTTVAKIERVPSGRQVNVDELVTLSWVLGVAPPALLTPTELSAQISTTPAVAVSILMAWPWMTGLSPIPSSQPPDEIIDTDTAASERRFYKEACPDYVVRAEERLPGIQNVMQDLVGLQRLAAQWDKYPSSVHGADHALDRIRETLRSIDAQVKLEKGHQAAMAPPGSADSFKRQEGTN